MKKTFRIIVVMFLVLVLTVSGISFAWFMENMAIKVSGGDNMNITVGGDLQIAWHSESPHWGTELKGNVKNIAMLDCSGDGEKFFVGEVGEDGDIVPGTMKPITGKELEGSVLELAIDIRTSHKMDVYLGSLSAVAPVISEYITDKDSPHNNSLSGQFSADWIAAAARVAIYEVEYDDNDNIGNL